MAQGPQATFKMIVPRLREPVGLLRVPANIPVNHAGQLLSEDMGRLALDTREYFAPTRLESKAPTLAKTRSLGIHLHEPSVHAIAGEEHLLECRGTKVSHVPPCSARQSWPIAWAQLAPAKKPIQMSLTTSTGSDDVSTAFVTQNQCLNGTLVPLPEPSHLPEFSA